MGKAKKPSIMKGGEYRGSKAGMRKLMSTDPIKTMVDNATSAVLANVQSLSFGEFLQTGFVTSEPPRRSQNISWHGFVIQADERAKIDCIRYGVLQMALWNTYGW